MSYYMLKGDPGFAAAIPLAIKGISALSGLFGRHRRACQPGEEYYLPSGEPMPCKQWPCYGCDERVLASMRARTAPQEDVDQYYEEPQDVVEEPVEEFEEMEDEG